MAKNEMQSTVDALSTPAAVPTGFKEIVFKPALGEEGEMLIGTYQGPASDSIIKGKPVKNFKVEVADGEIRLVRGTAQLIQFFETLHLGQSIWLMRGKQIRGGQGNVNTYRFGIGT